jgi:uncharacterized protein (TIGR02099 family)
LLVLVLLALYVSLGRQYIGLVDRYQDEIFQQVEVFAGLPLKASAMRGSWVGLSPVIELLDFQLGESGALRFDKGRIEIDLLSTLFSGTPKIRQIKVAKLDLDLQQDSAGRWQIPGLDTSGGGSPDTVIDTVLGIRNASLDLFSVKLHYLNGDQTQISTRDFFLRSDDKFRRAYAKLNTDSDGDIQVLLESYGDPRNAERFSASAYLVVKDSRLSALAPLFDDSAPLINSELSGEIWLSWRQEQRISISGVLKAPTLSLGVLWGSDGAVLDDVSMRFQGSHRDGFWRIAFSDFDAHSIDLKLDLSGVSVQRPQADLWQFSLPQLDLDIANTLLLESEALSPGLQATLAELAPKGSLRNIQFDLNSSSAGIEDFTFRAETSALSVEPWQGAPGANGLNGYLEIAPNRGLLLLDTERLALAFPRLYDDAFDLQNVKAELNWTYDNEHLALNSGLILAENEGVPVSVLLDLDLPLHKDTEFEPQMTLVIGAQNADAAAHQRFTPKVLSDSLLAWLKQSIRGGKVNSAGFIYRGSLVAATEERPAVQLHLDLADVELVFHPDWPALEASLADVMIDNGRVTASVAGAAKLDGLAVDDLAVAIGPMADGVLALNVSANAEPDFMQAQRLLTKTPLHQYVGSVFDHWRGEGDASVDFALQMPFIEEPKLQINVEADIDFKTVEMPDYRLSLNSVRGHLHYETDGGLSSRDLTARLYGQPMTAQIKQLNGNLHIDAKGNINMADVGRWTAQPVMGFFSGNTAAKLHIETGENAGLTVTSDLRGVDILLPQPLYKAAESTRNIKITLPFGQGLQVMHLNLADQLSLLLGFQEDAAISANLLFGAPARLDSWHDLTPGQLSISGRLAFADFDQWRRVYDRYVDLAANSTATAGSLAFSARQLQIDEVMVFDSLLESAHISLRSDPDAWFLHINSPQLLGDIHIPSSANVTTPVYKGDREYMNLPESTDSVGHPLAEVDPRNLLDVDLDIAKLSVGEELLGSVGFDLRTDASGAYFNNVRGNLRGIELATVAGSTHLQWLQDDSGQVSSQLQGQFGISDLGDVLERFAYSRVMETRRGNFDLNLQWLGTPTAWSLASSEGDFSFSFKDGRFLKTSDAASGTLRIFSIFNMANIVRRLKFDFRDVFKKGIYFDRMRGGLSLADGQLALSSPLDVHGPSSRFQMTGGINLLTEVPDLRLVATLPVGSNLPWVAALVGGLPAAAGVYVVSKVFEEQMDSFSSAVYEISGTIQEPELTFKNIFDDESLEASEPQGRSSGKPGVN